MPASTLKEPLVMVIRGNQARTVRNTMPRAFELRSYEGGSDFDTIIDMDKISMIRIEKEPGHQYENIVIRFVDGHETRDIVPQHAAEQFIKAYRAYLLEG